VSWLLDTNVVSELVRPRPDPGVLAWFQAREAQEPQVYLAALVLAEIWRGVLRMDRQNPRFARLQAWVRSDLPTRFAGRVLAFDEPVARTWGRLTATLRRGASPPTVDSLIAATAVHHGLVLVTRNVADMRHFPELALENPWR
jgi:toxin FitB